MQKTMIITPTKKVLLRAYVVIFSLLDLPSVERQGKLSASKAKVIIEAYWDGYMKPLEEDSPGLAENPQYQQIQKLLATYLTLETSTILRTAILESPLHQLCALLANMIKQAAEVVTPIPDDNNPHDALMTTRLNNTFTEVARTLVAMVSLPEQIEHTKQLMGAWWQEGDHL